MGEDRVPWVGSREVGGDRGGLSVRSSRWGHGSG